MEKIDRKELRKMIMHGEDVRNVDTSEITDMSYMLQYCKEFNQDISAWDVSNVKTMRGMFEGCKEFNQDLSKWDVSNVLDMRFMFAFCYEFNGDISAWDVSNVKPFRYMFVCCKEFNQDISAWDVSNETDMEGMFNRCDSFDFKYFKGKVAKPHLKRLKLSSYDCVRSFNKDRLIDYLGMYKHNDNMKMKVLSTLNRDKILYKQGIIEAEWEE